MPCPSKTISASEAVFLGNASDSNIGSFAVHVVINSGTLSAVPKGIVTGSGLASGERQNLAYKPANTGTLTNPGTTAITAEGIYVIPADGCDVWLDCTIAGGSTTLYWLPLNG